MAEFAALYSDSSDDTDTTNSVLQNPKIRLTFDKWNIPMNIIINLNIFTIVSSQLTGQNYNSLSQITMYYCYMLSRGCMVSSPRLSGCASHENLITWKRRIFAYKYLLKETLNIIKGKLGYFITEVNTWGMTVMRTVNVISRTNTVGRHCLISFKI